MAKKMANGVCGVGHVDFWVKNAHGQEKVDKVVCAVVHLLGSMCEFCGFGW